MVNFDVLILTNTRPCRRNMADSWEAIPFLSVSDGSRRLSFRYYVVAHVSYEEGCAWTCECSRLASVGFGASRGEAIKSFEEDAIVTCDGLVNEPDENLTLDAMEIRDEFRRLVIKDAPLVTSAFN